MSIEKYDFLEFDKEHPNIIHVDHPLYRGTVKIKSISMLDVLEINRMRASYVNPAAHHSDLTVAEWVIWVEKALEKPDSFPDPIPAKKGFTFVHGLYEAIQDFLE